MVQSITCSYRPRGAYAYRLVCSAGERCSIKGHFTAVTFTGEVGASLSEQRGEMFMVLKEEFDETAD